MVLQSDTENYPDAEHKQRQSLKKIKIKRTLIYRIRKSKLNSLEYIMWNEGVDKLTFKPYRWPDKLRYVAVHLT